MNQTTLKVYRKPFRSLADNAPAELIGEWGGPVVAGTESFEESGEGGGRVAGVIPPSPWRHPRRRWILASELWAATKDGRERILKPSLAWMRRSGGEAKAERRGTDEQEAAAGPRGLGAKGRSLTSGELAYLRDHYTSAIAAVLAAWVSLCPLAPQQAKREAVIAVDPVHAPVELVSRQRAAEQATRWGFTR